MTKDAIEIFSKVIPKAITDFPEEARKVNAVFCFRIHGEGGGAWIIDLVSDPPKCIVEDENSVGGGQCTIEMSHEDFKKMLSDSQLGMQLYFEDRLKISGESELATKLFSFFSLSTKEGRFDPSSKE